MSHETILFSQSADGVARLTLNRFLAGPNAGQALE